MRSGPTNTAVAHGLCGLTYTLPAWGRQPTRQLQERLDAFRKRARKFVFATKVIP